VQPIPGGLEFGRNAEIANSAQPEHIADLLLIAGVARQQAELETIVPAGPGRGEYAREDKALTDLIFFGVLEPDGAPKTNANGPVGKLKRAIGGNPEGTEASFAEAANRVSGEPQDFAIE
jgi:hypothetical protein